MNVAKYAASIFVGFLGFSVSANVALSKTFTFDGFEVTNPQLITINQVFADTPLPPGLSGYMGQIVLHGSGPDIGQDLASWCLDPITYISASGVYNVVQPAPLSWPGSPTLTQGQINQITSLISNAGSVISGDVNASAAIQLAIWQVEYGSSFLFTASSDIANLAITYIGYVTDGIWNASDSSLSLLISPDDGGSQALGFVTPSDAPDPTPLPSAIVLFGSVLGAGYFGLRRFGTTKAFG